MSKNAMAGAVTLCGVGLCMIGGALMMRHRQPTSAAATNKTISRRFPPALLCMAGILNILSSAAADGPGMHVFCTTLPPGLDGFTAPYRSFHAVGDLGVDPVVALPMILADRHAYVYTTSPLSPFSRIPQELSAVRSIGLTRDFIIAIAEDGRALAWGTKTPELPSVPYVDLSVYQEYAALVAASGTVSLFDSAGPQPFSTQITDAASIAIGGDFGIAIRTNGTTISFGYRGASDPDISPEANAIDISCSGTIASPRAVAVLDNGSLVSLTSNFSIRGNFRKAQVSNTRLIALTDQGDIFHSIWGSSQGNWTALNPIEGAYQDIAVPTSSSSVSANYHAICATDADQNGEADREQILRGEIPDVNGDLVDDRRQGLSTLRDEDTNGQPDVDEVAGVAGHFRAGTTWWLAGAYNTQVAFLALDRVPPQAELLRKAPLRHAAAGGDGGVPAGGLPAIYGIWVDPNGDGNPADAVQIFAKEVLLEPDGSTDVDLGGLWVGPPGTKFFHGICYEQTGSNRPAMYRTSPAPTNQSDPFQRSRDRGRCRFASRAISDSALTPIELVRESGTFDPFVGVGLLPDYGVLWQDRLPNDCDQDGLLDTFTINISVDSDLNGVIDSCEQDCDNDGISDVIELIHGAADCDHDLLLDDCEGGDFVIEETQAVPRTGSSATFLFEALPVASSPVLLTIEAVADLGALTESLIFSFEDSAPVVVFGESGSDCPATPDSVSFTYPAATFNAASADGLLVTRISASAFVDSLQCRDGFLRIRLSFSVQPPDCDGDSIADNCQHGLDDCDGNGRPDVCDLLDLSRDMNRNSILDTCELDCNQNGVVDSIEISANPPLDCDSNGYLDACEFRDCDMNGTHDACQQIPPEEDCNADGFFDRCQGFSDCDADGISDICESDCNTNGIPDGCEIADGMTTDKDVDGVPDSCEYALGDFDLDGAVGAGDLSYLLSVWGAGASPVGDLNGDGAVGAADLAILLSNWGPLR